MGEVSIIYLFIQLMLCMFQAIYMVTKFILLLPLTLSKYIRHCQKNKDESIRSRQNSQSYESRKKYTDKNFDQVKKQSIRKSMAYSQTSQKTSPNKALVFSELN